MADTMKQGMLSTALGVAKQEGGFVQYFKDAIRAHQGDGATMQTHRALQQAGLEGIQPEDVAHADEYVNRQIDAHAQGTVRANATIVLPNGNKVTPLEYQKLQQIMLRRGG